MTLAHGIRWSGPKAHVELGPVCAHLLPKPSRPSPSALGIRPWAHPAAIQLLEQKKSLFLPHHLPLGAEKLLYWLFILDLFNPFPNYLCLRVTILPVF